MSFSLVLAAIGNWQYSQAIVVERCENKAATLHYLCLWTTGITTLIALMIASILISLSDRLGLGNAGWWFLALPFSTFVGGYCNSMSALSNRQGGYKRIGLILVIPIAVSVGFSIALGMANFGTTGPFIAYFASQVIQLVLYFSFVPRLKQRAGTSTIKRVLAMMRRHRKFAIYTTPTTFISNFTMNAPVYALSAIGATSTIGLFSRANQLLSMPVNLIGSSIATVFQRRAAIQYNELGTCRPIYFQTMWALVAIGAIPTLVLGLFAPTLFGWFLGPKWVEAGEIARILAPMLLLRVICSPLSTVFYIANRQKEDLALSIVTSIITLAIVTFAYFYLRSGIAVIYGFSLGFTVTYLTYIIRSAKHCKGGLRIANAL